MALQWQQHSAYKSHIDMAWPFSYKPSHSRNMKIIAYIIQKCMNVVWNVWLLRVHEHMLNDKFSF